MTGSHNPATTVAIPDNVQAAASDLERVLIEIQKVIVGQERLVERIMVGLLSKGHVLLEGVPGVAKTLTVETFSKVIGGTFSRIQFTPDLVPSDLVGTRIYRSSQENFSVELGPVVANMVLADEINRAPAKVQSALLEVMAEKKVTIGGTNYPMPQPYIVLATQNPIENEGVFPLPEAQRDRFLFKLLVSYPSMEEEYRIITTMTKEVPQANQVITLERLQELQSLTTDVFVHSSLIEYVVRLIDVTRRPAQLGLNNIASWLSYGASPRASLSIISASKALALLRKRDYVIPQDIVDVIPDVLRHRLIIPFEAAADGITCDYVIEQILQVVPLPIVSKVG